MLNLHEMFDSTTKLKTEPIFFAIRTGSELSRSTSVNSVTSQKSHFLIIIQLPRGQFWFPD